MKRKFTYTKDKPLVIIGFGNPLLLDEGAGIKSVEELDKRNLPDNVTLIDGGTSGLDIIPYLEEFDQVIIIDCVKIPASENGFVEFYLDDVELNENDPFTVHELNVNSTIKLMEALEMNIPNIYFFGVHPQNIDYGIGLSDSVEQSVQQIVNKIDHFVYQTDYKLSY